ncbi:hypothetical protein AX14_000149 [Amanita brunnescens Koide BX004]|nr:hypothetical protein AX14_000149 [Amanita brunnescens Koide BX004]
MTHHFQASESPSETLPSLCVPPSSPPAESGSTSTESSPGDDCEEEDDLPLTAHGQDSVAPTSSSSAHGIPSGAPLTAVTSPTNGPSLAHTYGASELVSMKKHGSLSSSSSQVFTGGYATYFYQNGNAGACGAYHSDYDLIAAIDADRYGYTGEKSALCGKKVKIVNPSNGHSVVVTIADACPTCRNGNSIDLSVGAFERIADMSLGIVSIDWWFE